MGWVDTEDGLFSVREEPHPISRYESRRDRKSNQNQEFNWCWESVLRKIANHKITNHTH